MDGHLSQYGLYFLSLFPVVYTQSLNGNWNTVFVSSYCTGVSLCDHLRCTKSLCAPMLWGNVLISTPMEILVTLKALPYLLCLK